MQCSKKSCSQSLDRKIKKKSSAFPILTGILITILPKCPCTTAAAAAAATTTDDAAATNGSIIVNHLLVLPLLY